MAKMMYGTCSRGCCGRGAHGRTMRTKEKQDWQREAWVQKEYPGLGEPLIFDGAPAHTLAN